MSDYFGPAIRGKVYGLLQLTQPLGYMIAAGSDPPERCPGWRSVFYITGSLGLVLAVIILLFVRELPRPERAGAGRP
jgi:MFS family permease